MEIYIHIPFCVRKCAYCDFLSFPSSTRVQEEYVRALCEEIRQIPPADKEPVSSIFVGGGTPSVLEPGLLSRIFSELHRSFSIHQTAEITVEANPGTLSRAKLKALSDAGCNRLSLGLQSPEPARLKALGRIHTWEDYLSSLQMAEEAGFSNINTDLMFALPGQTLSEWEAALSKTAGLGLAHISAYSLILEEDTPLAKDAAALALLPDEDTEYRMYDLTAQILESFGYHRYEISNYALPDRICRHNMGYWTHVPYLGLGLGAASYLHHTRFANTTDLSEYLSARGTPGLLRKDITPLDRADEMAERMILGLRLTEGVSRSSFVRDFGSAAWEHYCRRLKRYEAMGFLVVTRDRIRLTGPGIHVSNTIMADCL